MEASLEAVLEEDRPIVRNIIAVLESLHKPSLFTSWTCHVGRGHYLITAFFASGDWSVSSRELDVLYDVNPLRVLSVVLGHQAQKLALRIKLSDRDAPIMISETQLVSIRKRSRWT
jgi:hypothetical protein